MPAMTEHHDDPGDHDHDHYDRDDWSNQGTTRPPKAPGDHQETSKPFRDMANMLWPFSYCRVSGHDACFAEDGQNPIILITWELCYESVSPKCFCPNTGGIQTLAVYELHGIFQGLGLFGATLLHGSGVNNRV